MADYPEWVMKHKKKGTYVNIQNGKYYLYAAHSERIPGTGKVRRISDGYLGRITEESGFIPAKKKLPDSVCVYEYGLSETIVSLCGKVHSGLRREFRANADFVMACGALLLAHGTIRREFYETSWLSVRFPGLDMGKAPTGKQQTGIGRAHRMIADTLKGRFGEDYEDAVLLLPLIKAVKAGGEAALAAVPEGMPAFLKRHGLSFGEVENG